MKLHQVNLVLIGICALATCKPLYGDLSSIFYLYIFCSVLFIYYGFFYLFCLHQFLVFVCIYFFVHFILFVCFDLFCLHQVNLFFLGICAVATCKPQNGDLSSINTKECKGWRTFQPQSFQPRIFNQRFLNPKLQPRTFKP